MNEEDLSLSTPPTPATSRVRGYLRAIAGTVAETERLLSAATTVDGLDTAPMISARPSTDSDTQESLGQQATVRRANPPTSTEDRRTVFNIVTAMRGEEQT